MSVILVFLFQNYIGESNALGGSNICPKNNGSSGCCYNYHAVDGKCEACPVGTYGNDCNSNCARGYFGLFCKGHCKCDLKDCDIHTGCVDSYTTLSIKETEKTESLTTKLTDHNSTIKEFSSIGSIPVSQQPSTVHFTLKGKLTNIAGKETGGHLNLTSIVAVVSSTVAVILLVVLFFLFLRRKINKIKKRDKEERMDRGLTTVVMSKIYDEINDIKQEETTVNNCKLESLPDNGEGRYSNMGGVNDGKTPVTAMKSRGSYAVLLEYDKEDGSVSGYDTLDRKSESAYRKKEMKGDENENALRIIKPEVKDQRQDDREITHVYDTPRRQIENNHSQVVPMDIYQTPPSRLILSSEIPPLPKKKENNS